MSLVKKLFGYAMVGFSSAVIASNIVSYDLTRDKLSSLNVLMSIQSIIDNHDYSPYVADVARRISESIDSPLEKIFLYGEKVAAEEYLHTFSNYKQKSIEKKTV